ncbi:hypothetical protein PybrP1_007464 [[Pythium] brassicae (nom. inval.)]|nr:hypothetical protein PybrP1_007464 [[Pythium] brassicae (nom. inval.)]
MAPNTSSSSLFNGAHPPPQPQTDAKADGGVLVVAAPSAEPAVVAPVSASSASSSSVSSSSTSVTSAPVVDSHQEAFARRRLLEAAAVEFDDCDEEAVAEREFQLSRFARLSPAALDGVKAPLGFRKSCLKRSNSQLPADLAVLKAEAEVAAAMCVPVLPTKPVQKNRRRCWECKVKVGLTAVTCRCDYTFCNKHRYAEEHACAFDFKVSAKRKLEVENPRVVPAKVARIN